MEIVDCINLWKTKPIIEDKTLYLHLMKDMTELRLTSEANMEVIYSMDLFN